MLRREQGFVLALCDCSVDVTGHVAVSLDLIERRGLTVLDLDGSPREQPDEQSP